MKRSIHKSFALLLAGVLLLALAAPALAAEDGEVIRLRTAADLAELSRNCSLDSWSREKTVCLERDIDLTGTDFTPIPTFGGVFLGQGHTISGLSITGSGNVRGLFRYIQPSGEVHDLTVEGEIAPSGRQNTLGGLAGNNQGILSGCAFSGSVAGRDSVGGLVGINEAQGQIINCTFSGSVTGEHYVGGIAGQNYGAVIQCGNRGNINTTEVDAQVNLDDFNREQLNAAENVPVCTDIGGIAGYSSGILQSCTNAGAVGYAHVGYNIGGIVGRQSGYLSGCVNAGAVLGRKDVGGIAGQLEPEVRLLYNDDRLGDLLDGLDTLQALVDGTGDDLRASSSLLSERMDAISSRAGEASEAVEDLMDSAADWANGNIGEVNSLSARLSWLADRLAPILTAADSALNLAEDLAVQLNDVLDEALEAGGPGADAAAAAEGALRALRAALAQTRASREQLQSALAHLEQALGKGVDTGPVLEELFSAFAGFADDCGSLAEAVGQALELLWSAGGLDGMTGAQREEWAAALEAVRSGLSRAADALPGMGSAMAGLAGSLLHPEELEEARKDVSRAGESFAAALRSLADAARQGQSAAGRLRDFLDQAEDVGSGLREAGDTAEELAGLLAEISGDIADTVEELSEMPTITIRPFSADIQAKGDALGEIFRQLLEDGDVLRETAASTTDLLLDDLDAIGGQFSVVLDLLRDVLEGDEEEQELFEDVSDQETGTPDTGAVISARNTGRVEGDINTGGIVGSMAIEYDFDPEDDLIQEGDRSLDFRYQARAAVLSCVNTGDTAGKEDYTGGIVGLMDLGRVSGCENYGGVAGTSGDYVGGIAGASWGSIRGSWAKCHLSGGDYIGGVAGLGATIVDCHTLVTIAGDSSTYLGAIAGGVDQEGNVSGNTFTSDTLGAVDGISCAGAAEPVDFDALCAADGAPERFSRLELAFTAGGETIAVIPFLYGEGIDDLPEIPAREGYSAAWPELDYTHLTASQTLEAIYTPYTSALSAGEGLLPEILVDGSFSSRASMSYTSGPATWTDEDGVTRTGTAYTITVKDPDLPQTTYTVHYRLPDAGKR